MSSGTCGIDELTFGDAQQEGQAVGEDHEVGEHTAEDEESGRTDDERRQPSGVRGGRGRER